MNKDNKKFNKELCDEMPFLIPRNCWTNEIIENYDYEITELDLELPIGWKNLAIDMFREMNDLFKSVNFNNYSIVQLKEKFGELRLYSNGVPKEIIDKYYDIVEKYTHLSSKTCVKCGNNGKMTYVGWISPFCKECWNKTSSNMSYEEATKC